MLKYPRTQHLEGSRFQPGDENLDGVAWSTTRGGHWVVEEKVDGANAGLSFDEEGELRLQSRGHFLTGGHRERHFHLFKAWASAHQAALRDRLGSRYLVYGEWLYAHHTVYYDALPHYFLEFDVWDHERALFLSTPARRELLDGLPIASVPVLSQGALPRPQELAERIAPSLYKTPRWREHLEENARALGLNRVPADRSDLAEGLYLKREADGQVLERLKFIRPSFYSLVQQADEHWLDRPIVPNGLAVGVDIFAC